MTTNTTGSFLYLSQSVFKILLLSENVDIYTPVVSNWLIFSLALSAIRSIGFGF